MEARAGSRIFFGDGTGTTIATTSINGAVTAADSHSDLSYTVNADCTGTLKVLSVGANLEIFIAPNGDGMTVIATDKGHVEAYSSWRGGAQVEMRSKIALMGGTVLAAITRLG